MHIHLLMTLHPIRCTSYGTSSCSPPPEDTDLHSISPATILTLLEEDDASCFSTPITRHLLATQMVCLQADGGANHSATNNRDMLHVSLDIADYCIGSIGMVLSARQKECFTYCVMKDLYSRSRCTTPLWL